MKKFLILACTVALSVGCKIAFIPLEEKSDMTDEQRAEMLAQMENLRKNAPHIKECINKFNAD